MTTKEHAAHIFSSFKERPDEFVKAKKEYNQLKPSDREAIDEELLSMLRGERDTWELSSLVSLLHILEVTAGETDFLEILQARLPESKLRQLTSISPQKGGVDRLLLSVLLLTLVRFGSSRGIEIARKLQNDFEKTWVGRAARSALSPGPKKNGKQ
jgi:hypothetical protein